MSARSGDDLTTLHSQMTGLRGEMVGLRASVDELRKELTRAPDGAYAAAKSAESDLNLLRGELAQLRAEVAELREQRTRSVEQQTLTRSEAAPLAEKLSPTSLRLLSQAAGELHGLAMRRMLDEYEDAKGDETQVIRRGLLRLKDQHLLPSHEYRQLLRMVETIDEFDNTDLDKQRTMGKLHNLYQDLLEDDPSDVARAMASITIDSTLRALASQAGAPQRSITSMIKGDVMGAVGGLSAGGNVVDFLEIALGSLDAVAGGLPVSRMVRLVTVLAGSVPASVQAARKG